MYEALACSEVDDEIKYKESIRDTIEDHPASAEVVVEERDGHRQNHKVGQQCQQHEYVPVKPAQ